MNEEAWNWIVLERMKRDHAINNNTHKGEGDEVIDARMADMSEGKESEVIPEPVRIM